MFLIFHSSSKQNFIARFNKQFISKNEENNAVYIFKTAGALSNHSPRATKAIKSVASAPGYKGAIHTQVIWRQ